MDELIRRLLDEGYEVYFSKDDAGYVASVSGPGRSQPDGALSYESDCIAGTALDALVGAAPQDVAYEATMLPKGEHPYPDGPDCICGHACRDHAIRVGTGGVRSGCTECDCRLYVVPPAEETLEDRVGELEAFTAQLDERTRRDQTILIQTLASLVRQLYPDDEVTTTHVAEEEPAGA